MAAPHIIFSPVTLARKIWLDQACITLLDYREPGYRITDGERNGLACYIDWDMSPADAAELYQAALEAA